MDDCQISLMTRKTVLTSTAMGQPPPLSTNISRWTWVTTTPPQPFYGPFSGTTRVSRCQKRTNGLYGAKEINTGRHTDHLAGRHSIRTNQCPPPPSPYFFTGRMPFLLPNQQHKSTEGKKVNLGNWVPFGILPALVPEEHLWLFWQHGRSISCHCRRLCAVNYWPLLLLTGWPLATIQAVQNYRTFSDISIQLLKHWVARAVQQQHELQASTLGESERI